MLQKLMSRFKPGRGRPAVTSRHEPFCTVLLEQSANLLVSQEGMPAKPDGLTYPLGTGPTQTRFAWPPPVVFMLQSATGCVRINGTSSGPAQGEVMFLASKIGRAGIAFTLLTTGMVAQDFPRSPAGSDSKKEGVAAVHQNEIKKMQETLRNRGHHRGKVDGVFGLRTRASIRAYQKAENLPITGQVDTRTADGLGVRPETNWGNSKSAGPEVGHGSDRAGGEIKREKPSAGIRRADGRASKTWRKEVSRATATEDNRGEGANKQQAENEKHDQ